MNCPELSRDDLLEKYLRRELGPAEQDEFETHILECAGCLQALETFQAVWDGLTERAHEIRLHTPVRGGWLRWQWAAVVSLVAIAGVIGLWRFDLWHKGSPLTRTSSKPPVAAQPAKQTTAKDVSPVEALPAKPERLPRPREEETASHAPVAPLSPPVNQQAKSEDVAVPTVVPPAPASIDDTGVAAAVIPPPAAQLPKLAGNDTSAEDVAKELFRLGVVQAPPYTFSGFVGSSKVKSPKRTRDSGLGAAVSNGGAGPNADLGRAHFQNAMDAYVEKRYATAAGLLEEAIRLEPNAPDSNFFLGICRLLLAKPEDAIEPLQTALAGERSPYTQAAHFYLAKAYVQTGDLSQAESESRAASAVPGRLTIEANSMLTRLQAVRALQSGPDRKQDQKQDQKDEHK